MEMGIQPHRPSPLFRKRAFSLPSWPSTQPSSSLYLNRGQPHFFQAALPIICYSDIIPGIAAIASTNPAVCIVSYLSCTVPICQGCYSDTHLRCKLFLEH